MEISHFYVFVQFVFVNSFCALKCTVQVQGPYLKIYVLLWLGSHECTISEILKVIFPYLIGEPIKLSYLVCPFKR